MAERNDDITNAELARGFERLEAKIETIGDRLEARIDSVFEDHEERLRRLERTVWVATGFGLAGGVSGVVSLVATVS